MSLQAPPLLIHLYAILPQCITAGFIWNALIIENKAGREIAGGCERKFSLLHLRLHPLLAHCDATTLLPVLASCGAFCNNVLHVYQQRHRMVMDILKQELETGVHALSIQVIADSVRVGTLKSSDGLTIESFTS